MAGKTTAARKQNRGRAIKESTDKNGTGYACNICGKVVSVKEASKCKPTDLICCGKSMSEHEDYFD